jgi:hypothetical protein
MISTFDYGKPLTNPLILMGAMQGEGDHYLHAKIRRQSYHFASSVNFLAALS